MAGSKSASAVRAEAARLATEAAGQRERDGDPEGAGVLRDLARDIRAIRIEGAGARDARPLGRDEIARAIDPRAYWGDPGSNPEQEDALAVADRVLTLLTEAGR